MTTTTQQPAHDAPVRLEERQEDSSDWSQRLMDRRERRRAAFHDMG